MRLVRLSVSGFRNLEDAALPVPERGVVLHGWNGQGKTNLLEAIFFPVLFRSLRGAPDHEVVRFGAEGYRVAIEFETRGHPHGASATFRVAGRRKQSELDGAPLSRLSDGAGIWVAVAFVPDDVKLASGPAAVRRLFLDRTLALADRKYFAALSGYRRALEQRNAALRSNRLELARAFDEPLARYGSAVIASRQAWVESSNLRFREELDALGETAIDPGIAYTGNPELADSSAWPALLEAAIVRDQARAATSVGPHRDDLAICFAGRSLRDFGSTGQQRGAALALKLLELETLRRAIGETPVLLLDDVFAELDGTRQERLSKRLLSEPDTQIFVTTPRPDALPFALGLPRWRIEAGAVETD